jgi:hypothetical protein
MLVATDEKFFVIYPKDMISITERAGLMIIMGVTLKEYKNENPQVMGMMYGK